MQPWAEKKEMILKTIEIRLEGISSATARAKLTFIIALIASSAMLIAVFNSYHSWTKTRAFDREFLFLAESVTDEPAFISDLSDQNKKILESFSNPDIVEKKTNLLSPNGLQAERLKELLNSINKHGLPDDNFYKQIDNATLYKLFSVPDNQDEDLAKKEGGKLKEFIAENLINKEIDYYPGTNHVNMTILQAAFPQIKWGNSFEKSMETVPRYEFNRRIISQNWINSQDVGIGLLGVTVNVDQFSLLGSLTLMIISFWMLFSFRRENRSIVSLLRDITKETKRPDGRNRKGEKWEIAHLVFQGIAHKLVFAHTGRSDQPMSKQDIFTEGHLLHQRILNHYVALVTKVTRTLSLFLILLPPIAIAYIIYFDLYSSIHTLSPFSINPASKLIHAYLEPFNTRFTREIKFGVVFGSLTLFGCLACLIFQVRTTQALKEYERNLYPKKGEDGWVKKTAKWLGRSVVKMMRWWDRKDDKATGTNIDSELIQ